MRKGIVLELERKHAVVLTRDGQFVRVPMRKRQWSVGEEVSVPAPRRLRRTVVAIASVCAAAVLFLLAMMPGFGGFGGQSAVAAYITLDINPSVELALNASDLVIAAKGLDEEGGALLSELALAGLPLETAANLVVEQAFRMNMLSSNGDSGAGTILITGTVMDERNKEKETVLLERVTATVKEAMTDNHPTEAEHIAVESLAAPVELREVAAKAGVSPGQLAIRLLAEELVAELPDDNQLVPSSVSEIARSVGGIGKLIQEAKARDTDGWKQLLDSYKQRHAEEQELAVQDEGKQDNRGREEGRHKDEDRADNKGKGKANGRNDDKGGSGKDKGGGNEKGSSKGKANGNGNKNGSGNGNGNGIGKGNGNGNGNVQKSGGSPGGHDNKNSQAAQIDLHLDTFGRWFDTVEKGLTFPAGTAKIEAQSNKEHNDDKRNGDNRRKNDERAEDRWRGVEKNWHKDRDGAKNGSRDKGSDGEKERSRNERENGTSKKNDRKSQTENGNAGKKTSKQAEKNRKNGDSGKEKKKRDGNDD